MLNYGWPLVIDYLQEYKSEKTLRHAASEFGVDPKAEMYKLPAKYVGAYAEQDAAVTLRLYDHLLPILEREECTSIFQLESSLIPVMLKVQFDKRKMRSLFFSRSYC